MKNFIPFLISLLCLAYNIQGQEPIITMTSAKSSIHNPIMVGFSLKSDVDNNSIQIDFGDGIKVNYIINVTTTYIEGALVGTKTIKIYGTALTELYCDNISLTTLDLKNNTALTKLSCYNNLFTSLDLKNNTALTYLSCGNNTLENFDIKQNKALTFLRCEGCNFKTLDLTNNTALTDLYCDYNVLTTLDLSNNKALSYLNCEHNQLASIILPQNGMLASFTCNDNQLTTLNLSNNASLSDLHCQYNKITTLDVTNNIALIELDCSFNQITTLNVTKNTHLTRLYCDDNYITDLYVTKNIELQELWCTHNQLTSIDVTNNIALKVLFCYLNKIATIDITKNIELNELNCWGNQLKILDATQNTKMNYICCSENQIATLNINLSNRWNFISCERNNLSFATLPLKQAVWRNYLYSPQAALPLPKDINIGAELDLSSQFCINDTITLYNLKTIKDSILIEDDDYTITNGKIIFLKPQTDSIYCEMTNSSFPDFNLLPVWNLKTTFFKVSAFNPTSIDELINNNGIKVYPNPTNNIIEIILNYSFSYDYNVDVYDNVGRLLQTYKKGKSVSNFNINLSKFSEGFYMIRIYSTNRYYQVKVIKK
jgi:hypothetical protein